MSNQYELATFAGGCFWCMVEPFDEQPGIMKVVSGYTGGHTENPTYEEVCSDTTGHYEAVQITFDPAIFHTKNYLGCFGSKLIQQMQVDNFMTEDRLIKQQSFIIAINKKKRLRNQKLNLRQVVYFNKPIVTEILPATTFYEAEEKHQDYYKKMSFHYNMYKEGSGRAKFIREHWKTKKSDEELRQELTPIQYQVTKHNATEPPFQNEYWNHEEEGIYVDIISGEPLFSSKDKYDAGCGWPSFTKPLRQSEIEENSILPME